MKPRTKLQFQVIKLSETLPDIEDKILSWAKVDCLEHRGYATKKKVVCMDCGQTFSPELVKRKRAVCPHCQTKISVEQSRKTTDKQRVYVAIAEIHDGFQVIRNFDIYAYYRAGKQPHYFVQEILQHWILPNGKREVISRNHTINWYCDFWNGKMEIRQKSYTSKYDVYPYKLHPSSRFWPELERCGIDYRLQGITSLEAITHIPKNPQAETLLKAKQYNLLQYCIEYPSRVNWYWSSIKICLRNKYIVNDVKMWIDYLDLLSYFQKDLRNAHYVCPVNVKHEHDKLVARKRRFQERENLERKRRKAIEDDKIYQELKAKFFGIEFGDDLIHISVLQSVKDVMEEGDAMHHCVFTNEYYKKKDSLLLSARIKDKRLETIEVSLKKFDVLQSHAACNGISEYHDRIIKLVKKNMNLIRQKMTA